MTSHEPNRPALEDRIAVAPAFGGRSDAPGIGRQPTAKEIADRRYLFPFPDTARARDGLSKTPPGQARAICKQQQIVRLPVPGRSRAAALTEESMATGLKTACDAVLNKAVNSTPGVPGVAAVATDRNGNIYEGVVGKRLASATARKAATDLANLDRQLRAKTGHSRTSAFDCRACGRTTTGRRRAEGSPARQIAYGLKT